VRSAAKQAPAGLSGAIGRKRSFDVGQDGALRPGGRERLREALHVHECALAFASCGPLDRDEREDKVGAHVRAVAERDHAAPALLKAILHVDIIEHMFDDSTPEAADQRAGAAGDPC
jgi:hypothetical protein